MGYSTQKAPFDLTAFLQKKGTPRHTRYRLQRRAPEPVETEAETTAAETLPPAE